MWTGSSPPSTIPTSPPSCRSARSSSAPPGVTEGIKWNAPSFRTTEWFATFHLRAKAGVMVILRLGAKVKAGDGITVDAPDGMLTWLGKDRASVTFADKEDVEAKREAFASLIRCWVEHV